jgi:hypothetical protein
MRKARWFANDSDKKFKELISDPLFLEAIYVVFGETMAHQMPGADINAHALNDSFRDGAVWALGELQALANAPTPRDPGRNLKPWVKKRPELDGLENMAIAEAVKKNE